MEGDFAIFFPQHDYRDRYRPGGGSSQLTLRRLLVLVDRLPPESEFKSAVEDRSPVSEVSAAVGDLVRAWTGEPWHRWSQLQRQREKAEFEALVEQERVEAQSHNAAYLAARKSK